MVCKIEIKDKPGIFDAVGEGIKKDILDLGIGSVRDVRFIQVYTVEGNISEDQIKKICEELLVDRTSQAYSTNSNTEKNLVNEFVIEIAYNPGVMDPVEDSTLKGIRDLGIAGVSSIKTAKKYLIKGKLSTTQLKTISEKLLYNKLIQHVVRSGAVPWGMSPFVSSYQFKLITVDLLGATDKQLKEISKDGQLFLNLAEMRQIKNYFKKQKRNPTDCELETIAQTWSEHCWHKTFRGRINYSERLSVLGSRLSHKGLKPITHNLKPKLIDNLLISPGVCRYLRIMRGSLDSMINIMFVSKLRRTIILRLWSLLAGQIRESEE
jgi:phosphoribosylformylglycinamidine synthase